MRKFIFSVIIPVYNVQDYISNCIDSVIQQTFKNIEIIIIDDGSLDESGKICDEYAKKENRIKVIHQENKGLSEARNTGVKLAKGEYLVFLDSDDFWNDKYFLENINKKVNDEQPEVIIVNYVKYFEENGKIQKKHIQENKNFTIKELIKYNILKACAWDKIVKREILIKNKIFFPAGKLSEDIEWCGKLIQYCDSWSVYVKPTYVYRQRKNSITKTITSKHLYDVIEMCNQIQHDAILLNNIKKYELLNFIAYEYTVSLGLVSKIEDENLKQEYKKYIHLLDFNWNMKVKMTKIVKCILGVNLTMKLLEKYIENKNNKD